MPVITRDESREVVRVALRTVASFSGDFEGFTFRAFSRYHKRVFLASIKNQLNTIRPADGEYVDIRLRQSDCDGWPTFADCIDWVRDNAVIVLSGGTEPLKRADLEE